MEHALDLDVSPPASDAAGICIGLTVKYAQWNEFPPIGSKAD
jgi:hypothetical protein